MRARLSSALGREPTISELAEQLGLTAEEIAVAETAAMEVESIHRECGEEGFTLESILTDTESEERMLEKIALRQAISELPEREKTVISLRYYHGLTQDRVAKVLGVSQDASEEEIRRAYLELVKKYHPDKYQVNPLADLAEEKLQEVNEAYDMLKDRPSPGARASYGPAGGGYANTYSESSTYSGSSTYMAVRQALDMNELARAEQMLINTPEHDAEWFFLSGVLQYKKGYIQNGMANVEKAMEMDVDNQEYRAIYRQMAGAGTMYRNRSDQYGYPKRNSADDALCMALPLCFCMPNPFCWC
jgi:molecular chaperone DnaJ